MPNAVRVKESGEVHHRVGATPYASVRRLGSVIGLASITVLDLLALDDITTAGAWMPEIGFVIASIPALIALGYFAFRRPPAASLLEGGVSGDRLER